MGRTWALVAVVGLACGDDGSPVAGESGSDGTTTTVAATSSATIDDGTAPTSATDPDSGSSDDEGTSETGDPIDPPPVCADAQTGPVRPGDLPDDYGFATEPPQMALTDTFYTYDLRTNIGACATDRVQWQLVEAPAGAVLEIDDASTLAPGESVEWNDGGDPREAVKLAWSLQDVSPGCHAIEVRWRAWRDCGALEDGDWGPEMSQRWEIAVRENHWVSGDLHVHTRHSERGDEAGGAFDYYQRMINAVPNDSGLDFADRRTRSLRGRLH